MSEELTESVEDVASWRYRGINQHPSYVGVMTREEAELRVKKDRDCRYLTSYDKTWNSYVLTAKEMKGNSLTKVTNFKIVISEKNSYHVEGKEEKKFDFYSDLINHHMKNELKNELLCVQDTTQLTLHQDSKNDTISIPLVDQALPTRQLRGISEHPSYHGALAGRAAQSRLKEHGGNCYLTRYSEDKSGYRLSVLNQGRNGEHVFQHFNIKIVTGPSKPHATYEVQGSELEFDDIFELLSYYRDSPLNHKIHTIGKWVTHQPPPSVKRMDSLPPPVPPRSSSASQSPSHTPSPSSSPPPVPPRGSPLSDLQDLPLPIFTSDPPKHKERTALFKQAETTVDAVKCLSDQKGDSSSSSEDNKQNEELVYKQLMQPNLTSLTLIKWRDTSGHKKSLRITEKVSVDWQTLGLLLGLNMPMLQNFRRMGGEDAIHCCRHVFYQWLENSSHSEYPATWMGVHTVLNDVGHGTTADELKEALESKDIFL